MNELNLDDLGLVAEQTSDLPFERVQMLAATLDSAPPRRADPLSLLWHWTFFIPLAPTSHLGIDGHPLRAGEALVAYPRRMWVGGAVESHASLYADRPTTRRTRIVEQSLKNGASGDFIIASLEHTVEQRGITALTERQDVVFRSAGGSTPPAAAAIRPSTDPLASTSCEQVWRPDHAQLFRFSAVTFNSHRIHYDHEYATQIEMYPDLVVHGPLTAMMLAAAAAQLLGRPPRRFSFRAHAPLFVDQPVTITGDVDTNQAQEPTITMTARRFDGVAAMAATAQ